MKNLLITTVQPLYHSGDEPDKAIRAFIKEQLSACPENGLILFPEYSNAGGLSDPAKEIAAMAYAEEVKTAARAAAAEKHSFVAVNVLEKQAGKVKNTTYLYDRQGNEAFAYHKQHLPPSEVELGMEAGEGAGNACVCTCEAEGIRFGFLTCFDVYFNEQIEHIAAYKPDVILLPGYQRGERTDILRAQTKMIAFRCNAYVVKSSYSMEDDLHGGCSMIVAPDGQILKDMGAAVGSISAEVDVAWKYQRSAGFGKGLIRNDDFINNGLCPEAF